MAFAIRLAAFLLLLGAAVACTSRPLIVNDAAPSADAAPDGDGGDADESLACASDDDCVATSFSRPVTSQADCYCLACAGAPVNRATDARFAAEWSQHCTAWNQTAACPIPSCPLLPPIKCVEGLCREGARVIPAECPVPPTADCGAAIACRGGCCKPGEWCDDQIGCRCGFGDACPVGQTCGQTSSVSAGQGLCGDVCCFDCSP